MMAEDQYTCEYKEDTQHLQGLPLLFVSQADLLLCVKDGDQTTGFLAHRSVLTAHSPVLGEMLGLSFNNSQERLPYLPMVGDDCSAVRSALACIYSQSARADGTPRGDCTSPNNSLAAAAVQASLLRLCHKYSMTGVAQLQSEALMEPLRKCANEANDVSQEQIALVLDCAAAAEDCGLGAMLELCEEIIITNFPGFAQYQALTSKLSSASMLRIAQGRLNLQYDGISDMRRALRSCVEEAKTLSELVNRKVYQMPGWMEKFQVSCPRCSCKLCCTSKLGPMQHDSSCKCKTACTWPNPQHT